jgi:hypothetical protein
MLLLQRAALSLCYSTYRIKGVSTARPLGARLAVRLAAITLRHLPGNAALFGKWWWWCSGKME